MKVSALKSGRALGDKQLQILYCFETDCRAGAGVTLIEQSAGERNEHENNQRATGR